MITGTATNKFKNSLIIDWATSTIATPALIPGEATSKIRNVMNLSTSIIFSQISILGEATIKIINRTNRSAQSHLL